MCSFSHGKLRSFHPELYGIRFSILKNFQKLEAEYDFLQGNLFHGDSRAAVVVNTSPLLVAAYTDEIDCCVLLKFSEKLVARYKLQNGTGLLTSNSYSARQEPNECTVPDLQDGPRSSNGFTNYHPIIVDFVSDDLGRIEARKNEIEEDEWNRTLQLGRQRLKDGSFHPRDGRPRFSWQPARPINPG